MSEPWKIFLRVAAFLLGCALFADANGTSTLPWLFGLGGVALAVWLWRDIKKRSASS